MKGKNFSCNNTGKRRKSDFYETPYSITQQFLNREKPTSVVLEPACGSGAIVNVLQQNGVEVIGKDISLGYDFLQETNKFPTVITNPPFSLAFEFILKCKEISEYFALLLPLSYLHGKKRFDEIYSDKDFSLSRVYVFTRYPMLGETIRKDGKYNTGMMTYAWFVWDKKTQGQKPVIEWINNDDYVLRKGDR